MRTFYFHLWFLLSFFYFFLAYSQPSQSGCLPYFHTWCGLSANLGCRSETCCTARGSLKRQDAKKSPKTRHHRTTLSGHIFPKKIVKQQYLLHMSSQYGELRPSNGWDRFGSLVHPSWFQRVSRLGSVSARHSSTGRQPNCGVEQRAPPIFGKAAITLGIVPWALSHILVCICYSIYLILFGVCTILCCFDLCIWYIFKSKLVCVIIFVHFVNLFHRHAVLSLAYLHCKLAVLLVYWT